MNWYYLTEENEVVGPVSEEALRSMLESGSLSPASQVCREGTEEWIELEAVLRVGISGPAAESQNRAVNAPVRKNTNQSVKSRVDRKMGLGAGAFFVLTVLGVVSYAVFQSGEQSNESDLAENDENTVDIQEAADEDPMNPASPEGQWYLGYQYHQGWDGIPQDFKEAEKWYRKSGLQGHKMAQASLGQMFLEGEGVEIDYKESARWWRYAAEQGLPIAQHRMGVFYLTGLAGEQDNKVAYMWLNLAAAGSDDNVASEARNLRAELAGQMTSSDLKEAQRLSREWTPKKVVELGLVSESTLDQANGDDGEEGASKAKLRDYYKGIGFSDAETEAVLQFFEKRLEPADAMATLAALYELRDMWDPDKVMYWNYKAAEAGSGDAMYRLAVILDPGFALAYRGYPKGDAEQSHNWIRKAADAGNPEGLNSMGSALWHGVRGNDGVDFLIKPNKREAIEWWRKAAKAGSSDARENLEENKEEISVIVKAGASAP